MTTTSDLADFLEARFDHDDRARERSLYYVHPHEATGALIPRWTVDEEAEIRQSDWWRQSEAEVASKRKLLALMFEHAARFDAERGCVHDEEALRAGRVPLESWHDGDWATVIPDDCLGSQSALVGLKLLAMPYTDHPDFREEWRVTPTT